MSSFFIFLAFISLLLLLSGIIKPGLSLWWGKKKTRFKVLMVYGLMGLVCFILGGITYKDESPISKEEINPELQSMPYFKGSISFEANASGTNSEGVELFNGWASKKITVQFDSAHYSQQEFGGLNVGKVIYNTINKIGYFLDMSELTANPIGAIDMDEIDEASRQFAPQFYNLKLEDAGEELEICGFKAKKYKILKGGALRDYASGFIWVTDAFTLPACRYVFENDTKKITAPVPLFVGLKKGTVLKIEVNENNVIVIYTATAIDTVAPSKVEFEVPQNFKLNAIHE